MASIFQGSNRQDHQLMATEAERKRNVDAGGEDMKLSFWRL